jgi:hypothetical protein
MGEAPGLVVSVIVPLGHELLELLEGGGGVAAVEAADGHDRPAGGQLDPASRRQADAFLGASWKRWIMRLDVDTA